DVVEIGAGLDANDVLGHDFADGDAGGLALFADDSAEDVALGEHADDLALVDHQERADLVLVHLVNGIKRGGFGADGMNLFPLSGKHVLNGWHDVTSIRGKAKTWAKGR